MIKNNRGMMKMNLCFFRIISALILSLFTTHLIAAPDAKYLKGLGDLLTQEYKYLSPSNGCLWWTTPVVESMYRYDPLQLDQKRAAVNKFMRLLFFLNNDQVNFNTMQNPTEIATYLTPNHIGQIIAVIENFAGGQGQTVEKREEKDVKGKGQEGTDLVVAITGILKGPEEKVREYIGKSAGAKGLSAKIGELDKVLNQLGKDQNRLSKQKEDSSKRLLKLIERIKKHVEYMQRVSAANVPEQQVEQKESKESKGETKSKQTNEELLKALQEDEKKLQETIKTDEKKILNIADAIKANRAEQSKFSAYEKLLKKSFAQAFALSCKEALALCNDNDYRADTVRNVLLAFMWAISENKKDLLGYFDGLTFRLGNEQKKKILSDTGLAVLQDEKGEKVKKAWIDDLYTRKDFEVVIKQAQKDPTMVLKDTEVGVLCLRAVASFNSLPEQLPYLRATYKEISFADCGETSLHNFFNAVLYSSENGKFVIERLTDLEDAKISPKLIAFYNKYPRPDFHDGGTARNDFAEIVSNLPGVIYNKGDEKTGKCEISSSGDGLKGFENMGKVIDHLTGFSTIKSLCNGLGIQFSENKGGKQVEVNLEIGGNNCKWCFVSGHFEFIIPRFRLAIDSVKLIPVVFVKDEKTGKESIDYSKLRMLGVYRGFSDQKIFKTRLLFNLMQAKVATPWLAEVLFFQNWKDTTERVSVCGMFSFIFLGLMKDLKDYHEDWIATFISLLYNALPGNDKYTQETFFKDLESLPASLGYKVFSLIEAKLIESEQKLAALNYLISKAPKEMVLEKEKWMNEAFKQIKTSNLTNMPVLVFFIIENNKFDAFKNELNYFKQQIMISLESKELSAHKMAEKLNILLELDQADIFNDCIARGLEIFKGASYYDFAPLIKTIKTLIARDKFKVYVKFMPRLLAEYVQLARKPAHLSGSSTPQTKFLITILESKEPAMLDFIAGELPTFFPLCETVEKRSLLISVIKAGLLDRCRDLVFKDIESLEDKHWQKELMEILNEAEKKSLESNDSKK